MIVARTLPIPPFDVFRNEVERLMDEALEGAHMHAIPAGSVHAAFPPVNVMQDEAALYVEAELPGFKAANVEIAYENDTLTIKGRRESSESTESAALLRRERWNGTFERTLRFAIPVDAQAISASLVNGILTVTLPKQAAALPRKIAVKPA